VPGGSVVRQPSVGTSYAVDELLDGTPDLTLQRTANTSRSLWSRRAASNAGPAKTVVGSGKRPTQMTAGEVAIWVCPDRHI
jgi:hypothetical protein